VGVGDDEPHPGQPAVLQGAQEPGPERLVLAVADTDAQHLTGPVGSDARGHDDRPGHHLAEGVVTHLQV